VAIAASAATGRWPVAHFALASAVWLLCRREAAGAGLVLAVAALARLPFALTDFVSDDVQRYVWEGRVVASGENPYLYPPSHPALAHLRGADRDRINHPDHPSVYPPGAQALFAACAGAGLGERGFRNVVLGLDVAVVFVLLAWLRRAGQPPGAAILYAWSPVAVASAAGGHMDPWMLLFLAGAGWAYDAGRARAAALLLAAAILAKAVALLLLPWLFLRRPRAAAWAGGLAAAGLLVPGLLGSLHSFGRDYAFNASLFRVLEAGAPDCAHALAAALLVVWAGAVALTQPRFASACALSLAGLLALAPTVHFWYLTWFLVALPAAAGARWTLPLVAWAVSVGFAGETYRAHAIDGAAFEERFLMTALEYAIPLACIPYLVLRYRPRRPALASPSSGAPPPGTCAVVIPCRGEAASLRGLLPAWLAAGATRVVVADTPTGDDTPGIAAALGDRVVYVPVARRGYGAAVQAGLAAAAPADFAIVCDADHALGPGQAHALLAPFEDPAVGLVTAARPMRSLSLPQRLGNALATYLIAAFWGRRFRELGPYRALRLARWPAGALTDRGYGWNVEMNVRALELGMRIAEVPLPVAARAHGRDRISRTLRGVTAAGWGILRRIYLLREQSCAPPS
jgi:hypothetical protein